MKRVLFIGVAFALLIALIFGVTIISEMTGGVEEKKIGVGEAKPVGAVFQFRTLECGFDPSSTELQNRMFRGFYEDGDEDTVNFWYESRTDQAISVGAKASCVSCSGARIANVSPELLQDYARTMSAGGMVAPMLSGGLNPAMIAAAIQFDAKLPWVNLDVQNINSIATIPGNKTSTGNGRGILQLRIKPSRTSSQTPSFDLRAGIATEPATDYKFQLRFMYVSSGFAVIPKEQQDVGILNEQSPSKSFDIITWSPVRNYGEAFPPQTVKADDSTLPMTIGPPEPFSVNERSSLAEKLSSEYKVPFRCEAAYRYRVTVAREKDGRMSEIGPFEKSINIVGTGGAKASLKVTGMIAGFLRLREGRQIDFGSFDAQYEKAVSVGIVSDRADVEIETLPSESKPRFLKTTLSPPETVDGRRTWKLTVRIDARQGYGALPKDAVVSLRTIGANSVTLRIPVTGTGVRR
jgi:hypothetical protein